jgi:S-DNA-T family DNA segregation ATPase FtsK/SpoIIIE
MSQKKRRPRGRSQEQLLSELAGVVLLVLAVVTGLGLVRLTSGTFLDHWIGLWRRTLGWGALGIPPFLGMVGVLLLQGLIGHPTLWPWRKLISGEIAYLALLTAFHALAFGSDPWLLADAGNGGGVVGWALSGLLIAFVGRLPTALLAVATAITAGAWTAGVTREEVRYLLDQIQGRVQQATPEPEPPTKESPPTPQQAPAPAAPESRPLQIITATPSSPKRPLKRDRRLPPLDLLDEPEPPSLSEKEVRRKIEIIEQTLDEFGLPVNVTEVRQGPVVTQFGVEPGYMERTGPDGQPWEQKVRVGQINALANDLALALAAPRLRIEAPVPGRSIVGIEVPNDAVSVVRLRGVIESEAFRKAKSPLAVGLGQDVSGAPVVADLAAMPHLLIAGTTGSGKSVCISSMVTCLAFNNPPERLRLVMIDPKLVEMTRFNGLPHLLGNVEVELDRIAGVLRWVTHEMDERYKLLSAAGARHLDDYNRRMRRRRRETLPYIVVFVDELADLMMLAAAETEHTVTRLAQMARAVGIHLVIATQRPSTDVVTGLIKANFPARISFAVASQTDSRVILDHVGAENLLGRGDMLFLGPESGYPLRVQSCFVPDREIEALVDYWREETRDQEIGRELPPWETMMSANARLENDRDPLLEKAIALVQRAGGASASLLQRRMRIGYPRAASIIDQMEQLGVIGPPESGGRMREVLVKDGVGYKATATGAAGAEKARPARRTD